jgi:hypothetical protein
VARRLGRLRLIMSGLPSVPQHAQAQVEIATSSETPGLTGQQEADQYLRAFKQRALDAAFESGARVKSVSYIDNEGRLHERAMFSSEADVRGVQIESYLDAMGGEQSLDAVRVSDDARCQLWTGSGTNSGSCLCNHRLRPRSGGV